METVWEMSHDMFRAERFEKWRQSRRRHMTCSGLRRREMLTNDDKTI